MLAALPLVFFGLCVLYFGVTNDWRVAFLKASIVWGLVVVASTEALSLFRALSFPALTAVWTLASVVAALGVWRRRSLLVGRLRANAGDRPRLLLVLALLPIAAIVVATGLIAWVAHPNTYDSMAYHMARVAHWIADGTVADYPTNILRQLYEPPWSEFAVLQLLVLSADNHLANLVQWFAMIGSVSAASLVALQLGATVRGQVLAATLVATLPMGILQASSTQTDYVVAFWLICDIYLALAFVNQRTPQAAAWFASALGLAMLSKGTAYIFAAPMVLVLGYWMLTRLRSRVVWPALIMLLIPVAINGGYFVRNEALFQNPLAPAADNADLVNDVHSPQAIASNLVRDGVLQFGTPSASLNSLIERGISRVHSQVLHIALSDPATTFPNATFQVNSLSLDEDYAGNPIQAILAIAAVLFTFGLALRRAPPPLQLTYSVGLVLACALFAAYLKWQPWHSRLELPVLVVAMPLVGALVATRGKAALVGLLGAAVCVAALPWVIDNQTRPLVGFAFPTQPRLLPDGTTIFSASRTDLYFAKRPELASGYVTVAALAMQSGCREVGFWSGPADWEYPLWVLTTPPAGRSRVDGVIVNNQSIHAPGFASQPCALVAVIPNQPESVVVGGVDFVKSWSDGGVSLYTHAVH